MRGTTPEPRPELPSTEPPSRNEAPGLPVTPEPQVGDKIGPYRLVKLLGQGTTGRVFEVEHERIGRRAAMKTLSWEHAARPGAIKRLFTEAMAVNRITNAHIVEVTDIVEDGVHLPAAGSRWASPLRANGLVMEILEGQSLSRAMVGEGPMAPERFLLILSQVCEALAAAHAAGFVHRDLKPDNVFLIQRNGLPDFVKLLDFGLAKTVNVDLSDLQSPALATLDGSFVGTPAYVSPEQASGKDVDHRTDIYSVGVILYELVCGRLPFAGDSIGDLLVKHLTAPPPPLPAEILSTRLGRTLDAIIRRCLDKNPDARFPSVAQLAEIFGQLGRGEPVQFTAMEAYLGAGRTRRLPIPRWAARLGMGIGVGLALSLLTGLIVARLNRDPGPSGGGSSGAAAVMKPEGAASRETTPATGAVTGEVTLSFDSEPPGAEARVVGAGTPLGVTPFQRQFSRSAAPLEIELALPGYEPTRVTTSAAVSRAVSVKLIKSTAALPRRARQPIGTETTIDPFR